MSTDIKAAFRSCFIADVQISSDVIRLQDTSHNAFYVDLHDGVATESFKQWFNEVFLKGVAQTPSIFRYHVISSDGAPECYVKKFILKGNAPEQNDCAVLDASVV